jgi:hypothetical protein
MAFDKRYPNRKDNRLPYRKSKRFDRTCRNHGTCSYCANNRAAQRPAVRAGGVRPGTGGRLRLRQATREEA